MPPGKRAEGPSSGSVAQGLSQLYQDPTTGDLSLSLSASLTRAEDEELTSLSWLHESNDLLISLGHQGLRSVSPLQDAEGYCEPSSLLTCSTRTSEPSGVTVGRKPPYSFSCLIFMAIEDAPSKRLPVKDIYGWIMEHFPYFVSAPTGWKNSVRHNLSLNKCFKKVDKDRSQCISKGSFWSIDPEYRHNLIQALKKTPYQPFCPLFPPLSSPQQYHSHPLRAESSLMTKNGVLLQVPQRVIQHGSRSFSQGLTSVIRPLPVCKVERSTAVGSALNDYLMRDKDASPSIQLQKECHSLSIQCFCTSGSHNTASPASSQAQEVDQKVVVIKEEHRDFHMTAALLSSQQSLPKRPHCPKGRPGKPRNTLPLKKRRTEKLLEGEDKETKEAAGSLLHLAGVRASQSRSIQHNTRAPRERRDEERD